MSGSAVAGQHLDAGQLAAARLWAADRFPYLASVLFACRLVESPGIGTIAVDERWRVHVDPALVDGWAPSKLGSMLVHEVSHGLREHADRARAMRVSEDEVDLWLMAADAEINDDLVAAGLDLHEPVLPEHFGGESGHLAEEYFEQVRDLPPESCRDCGSGGHGHARQWEGGDSAGEGLSRFASGMMRNKCAADVVEAHTTEPGTVPGGWVRWAEKQLSSRVDWRRVLAAEIRRGIADVVGAVDYSYSHPSRRSGSAPDVVLPSMRKPIPAVAIVCDTSGSMTTELLEVSLAEVEGLLRGVGVRQQRVSVYATDSAVQAVMRVSKVGQVRLAGGGGTDMSIGIAAALGGRPRPHVVVVLTDGFTTWPASSPRGARVVVGLLGEGASPPPAWAKTIRIEDRR